MLLLMVLLISMTALIPHFLLDAERDAGPVTHDGLHDHTVPQAYSYGCCLELEDGRDHGGLY